MFVSFYTSSLQLRLTEALFSLNSALYIHLFPSLDVLILKWLPVLLLRIFHDTEMLSKLPAENSVSILPYLCLWKILECILVKWQKYTLLVINHCCGQERGIMKLKIACHDFLPFIPHDRKASCCYLLADTLFLLMAYHFTLKLCFFLSVLDLASSSGQLSCVQLNKNF